MWVRSALNTNTSIELNVDTTNVLLDSWKECGDGTSCFNHQNIPHKRTISKFCDKNCLLHLIEPQIQPTWDLHVRKPKPILKNSLKKKLHNIHSLFSPFWNQNYKFSQTINPKRNQNQWKIKLKKNPPYLIWLQVAQI